MSEDAAFQLPEDITGITDEELAALHERAVNEFDAIYSADGGPQATDVARAGELADAIETLNSESERRVTAAAEAQQQFEALRTRVHGDPNATALDVEGDETDDGGVGEDADDPANQDAGQPELVTASGDKPRGGARTAPRDQGGVDGPKRRLNPSLANARARAPEPRVPDRAAELVITAAAATAGAPIGSQFGTLDALTSAVQQFAKGTSVTRDGRPSYVPLASIRNLHSHVLDERTDPRNVEQVFKELAARGRKAAAMEALVAAGGWCAPSEIRYDFFNVACESSAGIIDLPTFGVERGGIRFPVSPSLADVFSSPDGLAPFVTSFTSTSVPWLWTEVDDAAAITGDATKPCIRVPCPDFDEVRLECYGICLTAGNLADSAYPEATRNFLSLLMAAHSHAANFRYLSQMAALSTNVGAVGTAGAGTAAPLLGAVELAAIDYRTKYGMCDDDVLEVVLPTWTLGTIRSDLAKRTGVSDLMAVTDAQIAAWFDARGVRVQFVSDYQVRASGLPGQASAITAWPTTVEFMIYAAGTFLRGNGMTLDLGVVRDSTLNAVNDHTAAWMEECHLIARFGHESRRYQVAICTDGTTGANDLTACGL